jgi:hypothetical protein
MSDAFSSYFTKYTAFIRRDRMATAKRMGVER